MHGPTRWRDHCACHCEHLICTCPRAPCLFPRHRLSSSLHNHRSAGGTMAVGRQPLRARPPSLPLPLLLLSLCSSALAFGGAGQSGAGTPLSRFFEYPRTAFGGFNLQHAAFTSVDDCARLCLGDPLVCLACCMMFVLLAVYPMDSHSTRKARGVGSACCVALLSPPSFLHPDTCRFIAGSCKYLFPHLGFARCIFLCP